MATRNYTWGILTSGLLSIFFYQHLADDTNGEPHHILSCSPPVYVDAAHPSLFSLCAATLLLDAQDPRGLVPRPISVRIALEPYPYPPTGSPSNATRSKISQHGGSGREHRGRLACDVSGGNTPVEVDFDFQLSSYVISFYTTLYYAFLLMLLTRFVLTVLHTPRPVRSISMAYLSL